MLKTFTLCGALLTACASPLAAQDATPDTVYSAEAVRADFDQLYTGLREAHYDLFAATPRAVFDRRHAEMRAAFDTPMTRLDVQREFQTFAALARHAHARIDFPLEAYSAFRAAGGRVLPLTISVRAGRVFVETHAAGIDGLEVGDEILAFNGQPSTVWMPALTRHISAETPRFAHTLLEAYLRGLVWLEWPDMTEASLHVRHADGREETLTVPFLTGEALDPGPADAAPFSLDGRDARMIGSDIAYLRPGPFYNPDPDGNPWDPSDFIAFVDESFAGFLAAGAEALIIDLRDNPGGNNSFSDPMLAWIADEPFRFASRFSVRVSAQTTASNQARLDTLPEGEGGMSAVYADLFASHENGETVTIELDFARPRPDGERFEGPVYVLVNRYSFSNAVTTAALVQDYGFGTVAGETTADMATTYGAMEHFTLPRTGLAVGYPKAHIVRPNGTLMSHPVTPDIALDIPVLRGAQDTVLDQLVARARADLGETR
ncbi:MAG: S41 family peptidase [Pseudomonadota bacterium]|nr:S41 family peptidase [Pseudomonadota bacterium]